MKFKKILVILLIFVTIFCTTIPAMASGYSGYGPSASGTTESSPYEPSGGSTTTSPYMPGSGTGSGISGGGMPGSGTGSGTPGSGMPGSGSGGVGGGTTGAGSPSGASGSGILNASIDGSGSVVLSVPTAAGGGSGTLSDSISYVLDKYKAIGTAVFGICTITSIICLLWQITKLGMAGDNERSRSMAVKGIFISGAALAVFGSITLVAGMFWGAFL